MPVAPVRPSATLHSTSVFHCYAGPPRCSGSQPPPRPRSFSYLSNRGYVNSVCTLRRWRCVSGCIAEASRYGENGLLRAEGVGSSAAVSRSNFHRSGDQAGEQQPETYRHRHPRNSFEKHSVALPTCLQFGDGMIFAQNAKKIQSPGRVGWSKPVQAVKIRYTWDIFAGRLSILFMKM